MRRLAAVAALACTACSGSGFGGGSDGKPLSGTDAKLELVHCRSRSDSPHAHTEVQAADVRGLRPERILDRAGVETGVRVDPQGELLLFTRELRSGDPTSREILLAAIDGSFRERRLTSNRASDRAPCWSPDGTRIAFASDRFGTGHRLFLMNVDGGDPVPLHDDGTEQDDPDWSAVRDRIVFSRRAGPGERRQLWTIDAEGRIPVPLTDGGSGAASERVPGDSEPAWSPDGERVLFVRTLTDAVSVLAVVDVATSELTLLGPPQGHTGVPRWSPHGDRIFFARSMPATGLHTRQLWVAKPDGSDACLLTLDHRFEYVGLDVLPALPPAVAPVPDWLDVPLEERDVAIQLGRRGRGDPAFLEERDGALLALGTVRSDTHDRAGLEVSFRLPVEDPLQIAAVRVEVTAALTELDDLATLRVSVLNRVAGRDDTLFELEPSDEELQTLAFDLCSLAHVSREGRLRIAIVGEKRLGRTGELLVDAAIARVRLRPR